MLQVCLGHTGAISSDQVLYIPLLHSNVDSNALKQVWKNIW